MQTPYPLHPFPDGWFLVCDSDELANGAVVTKQFCGQEVVAYRTKSGKPAVVDAYCPHLGGHLGHGGTVVDETIRCPFHGFCFNTSGDCTSTGYGTRPSPKAKIKSWPVREVNGYILAWHHHANEKPNFDLPQLDWEGWSPIVKHSWILKGHPQETSENSVDIGHFGHIHGYTNVEVIHPLSTEGPILRSTYAMERPSDSKLVKENMRIKFDVHVMGLGYSHVESWAENVGLHFRQFIMATPIDGEMIKLDIGVSVETPEKPSKIHPLMALLPKSLIMKILPKFAIKTFVNDVEQDFKIWKNKIYLHPPALSQGDGPVVEYRLWARQFYPEGQMVRNEGKRVVAAKKVS